MLVLQPQLSLGRSDVGKKPLSQALDSPAAMAVLGLLPFGQAPIRPGQTQRCGTWRQGQGDLQETTHLWYGQLCQERFCAVFLAWLLARMNANQAWAIMDKVMWRYQLCQ